MEVRSFVRSFVRSIGWVPIYLPMYVYVEVCMCLRRYVCMYIHEAISRSI